MKGQIREIEEAKDFKEVYQVFSRAPYFEKYTEEELEEIFREYQEKGYVYGAFKGEKCIGLVALERGLKKEHPVEFEAGKKVMYFADLAVLDEYRNTGLGTQLMAFAAMQTKALGYEKAYMRTLEPGKSMSYGIARKIGFEQIQGVYQNVERERMDGNMEAMKNIFLELDLKCLNKDYIRKGIQSTREVQGKEPGE